MKISRFRLALRTAILTVVFDSAAHAEGAAPVPQQELQAKLAYCKTCHGSAGQGYRGSFPIPRLAGQQTEYFENQLRAFTERRRENRFMYGVAHVLSPGMPPTLAAHFKDLDPPPLGGAPKHLVETGKSLYEQGVPGSDIPPCASCHGPEAKGNGAFPRLAGQLNDYILKKIANWSKERGQDPNNPDTSAIMEPIAHNLTESQIAAVAAYVSYLK
jgi:cytochrome c553